MAITVVQSARMTTFATNPSLAFGSNNAGGNTLVILFYANTASAVTVTDTRSNTWNNVGTHQISNSGASYCSAFTCLSCAAGANTVTVNAGGVAGAISLIAEVSGLVSPAVENWTTSLSTLGSDSVGPITPSTANSIIFTQAQPNGNAGCTLSAPFSNPGSGSGSYSQGGWDILTSAAATSASYTGMGSSNGLVIFDISSGAAAPSAHGTVFMVLD